MADFLWTCVRQQPLPLKMCSCISFLFCRWRSHWFSCSASSWHESSTFSSAIIRPRLSGYCGHGQQKPAANAARNVAFSSCEDMKVKTLVSQPRHSTRWSHDQVLWKTISATTPLCRRIQPNDTVTLGLLDHRCKQTASIKSASCKCLDEWHSRRTHEAYTNRKTSCKVIHFWCPDEEGVKFGIKFPRRLVTTSRLSSQLWKCLNRNEVRNISR